MTHAWSTPLPHVYIHGQLHRSVTDSVNHIQLPLMALTWVTKILINVFRQSRCQTRVKVFVIFYNGDDRNDRNDKESEKSYVWAIARGLWISCHSCHLCHWGAQAFSLTLSEFKLLEPSLKFLELLYLRTMRKEKSLERSLLANNVSSFKRPFHFQNCEKNSRKL